MNLEVMVSVLSIIPEFAAIVRSVNGKDVSMPELHVGTFMVKASYYTTEFDVVALT